MKTYIRQIDEVTVKGSIKPIGLFTIDAYVDNLPLSKSKDEYDFTTQEMLELEKEKKKYI